MQMQRAGCCSQCQPTDKDARARGGSIDRSEPCLVSFKRGKTNSHLGYNAGCYSTEACTEGRRSLHVSGPSHEREYGTILNRQDWKLLLLLACVLLLCLLKLSAGYRGRHFILHTFVETQRRLLLDNHGARSEEASSLDLQHGIISIYAYYARL